MKDITIENLEELTKYNCCVNILRADNGKVVIRNIYSLKHSKDKRQNIKWEVFKNYRVHGLAPSFEMASAKRLICNVLTLNICAYMCSSDYDEAMKKYNKILSEL